MKISSIISLLSAIQSAHGDVSAVIEVDVPNQDGDFHYFGPLHSISVTGDTADGVTLHACHTDFQGVK